MLAGLLERNNYDTTQAANRQQTLVAVKDQSVDLVLLDLVLPDVEGLELLSELRDLKTATELPVIMVTGNDNSEQVVEAFRHGANDYVTKPVDVGIMLARINTQLQLRRAQAALRKSEERYALAARGTNDGLWDWDITANEVYFSPRWKAMLGIRESHRINSPDDWLGRIHPEDQPRAQSELDAHLQGDTPHFEVESRMRHEDGSFRWMLCRGLAVQDQSAGAQRMAGSLTDITEGKVADALTALPNRVLFLDRLQRCVDQFRRSPNRCFAVLYLDLDNFKLVNDSLGHESGDQLLIAVARRLEGSVRACEAVIARLGGDEFTLLLEQLEQRDSAIRIAQRIIEALASPFALGSGREVFASASVGITYPSSTCTRAEDLLREADTAMYEAKSQGRSCCRVFDPSMQQRVSARLELENQLRRAVDRGEFVLHYQSIVELETSRVVGFEALVRWQHPERGLISPVEFIPLAEETGLIVPMGRWVLREACRQMAQWKSQPGCPVPLTISVNVSTRQFSHVDLAEEIVAVLDQTQLAPRDLNIEVTESAIMDNPIEGAKQLAKLRDCGVTIGIDDFGTGYSSLASLHRLPLDLLKIDRSFINKMVQSPENSAIVRTILTLARSLNLHVVAEGIENEEQHRRLAAMGCQYGQGFYFSRPLAADQASELLWPRDQATVITSV